MSAALAELLEYLTPEEQREVDAHIHALTSGQPHVEYQQDPIGWIRDKLGIPESLIRWSLNQGYGKHHWDGTIDPLVVVSDALRDWKDVGVESGTGTGKSFFGACLILWFLACWEDSRAFTFAPKEDQLRLYIWKEIGKLWPKFKAHFPDASLTDLCIRVRGGTDDSWGARGYAVAVKAGETVSAHAQGMHAEHMLLMYEETPGIPLPVIEAGENTSTAPHNIRVAWGNPNSRLDTLHKFCTSPGVVHVRMSALDHPNVVTGNPTLVPGAISALSIARRRAKYGETSPVYQSRVRGVSPEQASDALIRLEWLEQAAARFEARLQAGQLPRRITGKGVDVANSEHGDRACIADFADNALVRLDAFQCPDANALGRQVAMEMDAADLKHVRVGVDTIGVGAGTYNELGRLRKRVQGLNASAKPLQRTEKAPDGSSLEWIADGNVFRTFRDQMYWQLREDLRNGRIDMPRDDELWEELTAPTFVDEPKTIIEPKDEIKDRLGRSPDKADAVVMGNWVRERRAPRWNAADPNEAPHHDPHVQLRTKDGRPPVWIGPEGDHADQDTDGYASQFPVSI